MNPLISIKNLTASYNGFIALESISFDVHQGEFIAIAGVNGSGKTTLIKCILNQLPIQTGTVTIASDIRVGYLPQHLLMENKNFPATVFEVVSTGLVKNNTRKKWLNKQQKSMIYDALKTFHVDHLAHNQIGALSGGQFQRVLLARSIVSNPQVLILDEPTSALDQASRSDFMDLLKAVNQQKQVTILLITHDLASVETYINRVLYLEKTLLFDGSFATFCETETYSPYIHTHPKHHEHD
jgi:zinc transport system ATP-binding protein